MEAGRGTIVRLTRALPDHRPDKRSLACLRSAAKEEQSESPFLWSWNPELKQLTVRQGPPR